MSGWVIAGIEEGETDMRQSTEMEHPGISKVIVSDKEVRLASWTAARRVQVVPCEVVAHTPSEASASL